MRRFLGNSDQYENVFLKWSESERTYRRDRNAFPVDEELLGAMRYCGIDADIYPMLISVATQIQRSDYLNRLAWHCRWRLFDDPEPSELLRWPLLADALGDNRGMFYLLVGLSMVPYVQKHHRSRSIPEYVTQDTCRIIRSFCESYQLGHNGNPGIQRSRISWLRHYPRNPLFRIRGLEYWIRENPIPLTVFRNRKNRAVVALMWNDESVGSDGYLLRNSDEYGVWMTLYKENDTSITGHVVHPNGRVQSEKATLSLDKWQRVLGLGDLVLQLHFPHGADIAPDSVEQSFRAAIEFFRRYYRDEKPVAFISESWVFSPILESLIGPESKAVRLQKELYIASEPPGGGGFSFIFPEDEFRLETATQKTRLQRAIVNHLNSGGKWRIGETFFLIDDIEQFGTQYYLNQFDSTFERCSRQR